MSALFDRLDQIAAFLTAHHCDAKAIDDAKEEIVRLRNELRAQTTWVTGSGKTFHADDEIPTLFLVIICMAAHVAERRGGSSRDYLAECFDYMTEVIGGKLDLFGPLPTGFCWKLRTVIEAAEDMMQDDDA